MIDMDRRRELHTYRRALRTFRSPGGSIPVPLLQGSSRFHSDLMVYASMYHLSMQLINSRSNVYGRYWPNRSQVRELCMEGTAQSTRLGLSHQPVGMYVELTAAHSREDRNAQADKLCTDTPSHSSAKSEEVQAFQACLAWST